MFPANGEAASPSKVAPSRSCRCCCMAACTPLHLRSALERDCDDAGLLRTRLSKRNLIFIAFSLTVLCLTLTSILVNSSRWAQVRFGLRMAASFLGFGWCEPILPPGAKEAHVFSTPVANWSHAAPFLASMPCSPQHYSVVFPQGCDVHARTPCGGSDGCDATIVTAYFDIGRAQWMAYSRRNDEYLADISVVMSLRNPMVIFTSPDLVPLFQRERDAHGFMDRTFIVGMSLRCMPAAHFVPPAERLMCKPEYLRGALQPYAPERQHVWYNALMWAKAYFFRAVQHFPQVWRPYTLWLDAGCHAPMCIASMRGTCVQPARTARRDRIHMAQTAVLDPRMGGDPVAFVKGKHVHFAGTIFGTASQHVEATFQLYADTLQWLLSQGAVDQDQSVFAYMFMQHPEAFDVYFVDNEWKEIVRNF